MSQAGDIGDRESTRRAPGDAHCDHQPPEPLDDAGVLVVTRDGVRSTAAAVMSTAESHGCPPGMFERLLSLRRYAPLISLHCAPRGKPADIPSSKVGRRVDDRRGFRVGAEIDGASSIRDVAKAGHLPQGVGLGCDAGYCANAQESARSRRKALGEQKSIILEKSVLARAAFRVNLQTLRSRGSPRSGRSSG